MKIKTISHEEIVATKINLLKQMNQYIIDMGDEGIWMEWIEKGVPDKPSEGDYEWFAENNEEWKYICDVFGRLIKEG